MTDHFMVLPVLIPLISAMVCLLFGTRFRDVKRGIGIVALLSTIGVAGYMVSLAHTDQIITYGLSNWPSPFGILFVLDRLSAAMVLLTSMLALFAFAYGITSVDEKSGYFHFIFLMQIAGVNGAFLTGDMFNLFVFFEILLLSAYVLVIYGGGPARIRTGIQFVLLNLVGSALFLIGVGIIYAVTGTLNMADMAVKAAQVSLEDAALLRAGGYLLILVFCIKSAMFPVYFWLPNSYAAASAPVAALFAIATKVGVYTVLRSTTLVFGNDRGLASNLMDDYLQPVALITLMLGTAGALGAHKLRTMNAYLVIASVGTILAGVGMYTAEAISGSLYYMIHSTFISAALFLVADMVLQQRGEKHLDSLAPGPAVREPLLIGMLFFICAIAIVGLPPVSGFIGKVMLLKAAVSTPTTFEFWAIVLTTSFFTLICLSRAGTMLFWKTDAPLDRNYTTVKFKALPVIGLLLCILTLTIYGGPISEYFDAAGQQIMNPNQYINAVLGEVKQ